jgi:hydroxymethylpyrimidine pyrophosphatase-like HAD family hydrolase
MPFLTLSQVSAAGLFRNIRLVATDMDGTLTRRGKFTPALLQALEDLAAAGIQVLIVTGRSAGWVSGLVSYLPAAGGIAENGGLFYRAGQDAPVPVTPISDSADHRQRLALAFAFLKSRFPQIQESGDNRFRITDWTFDVAGLAQADLDKMNFLCYELGWGFTYSSVQCHIKPVGQDKAKAVLRVLRDYFPGYEPAQVVTVGDSPNDESLFDAGCFPVSVGVANVLEYTGQLQHLPVCVTAAAEGDGFCELARFIIEAVAG